MEPEDSLPVYKSQPLCSILVQLNPVYILIPYLFQIHSVLPSYLFL